MDITYWAGPLGAVLLGLGASKTQRRWIPQAIALWVSLAAAGNAVWFYPALNAGHWSAILIVLTDVVAATSVWDSIGFVKEHPALRLRPYFIWWALFWASLIAIAVADNLAVSWLAIEFSTLASGALVVEMGHRRALEAAWKYIVIASVGLALGLIGIIFVYGSLRFQGLSWQTLNYVNLAHHFGQIPLIVREVATIFIVSGIGTKVGLVPFHTWLPDAHSEAPSPVSGLLSGILLGLSLFTIDRVIHALPLPPSTIFSGPHLLALFGALSVVVGALALLVQRDIKRLLAYSSIEQMGIIAIALGIGSPLAQYGALWQFAFHAVIKSSLFYLAGHLSIVYRTKRLDKITALALHHPRWAIAWSIGLLALAGFPPLGLAYSEWLILQALWQAKAIGLVIVVTAGLVLTFAALMYHLLRGLWGGLEVPFMNERPEATGPDAVGPGLPTSVEDRRALQ